MATVSCPWCLAFVGSGSGPAYCPECEHRTDVPQDQCDCRVCLRRQAAAALVRAADNDREWEEALTRFAAVLVTSRRQAG